MPKFLDHIRTHISHKKKRTASVGVDIDALKHYYRIHGLDESAASNQAWSLAVPRFLTLFARYHIPATFYCVAEDLEEYPENIEFIKRIVAEGHEIGNHTWRHPYTLTTLTHEQQAMEICEGKRLLETYSQSPVLGFRAPGYHTHQSVQPILKNSQHLYETSAFPCVPYYVAKSMVLSWMKIRGKESQSIMGNPRVLLAPTQPYWADPTYPYQPADLNDITAAMPHCPISVVRGIPMIGTAFSALGQLSQSLCRYALYTMKDCDHLTLEFHAADLLSILEDHLDHDLGVQPDLKVAWQTKEKVFDQIFQTLSQGVHWVRLDHYVRDFSTSFLSRS